VVQQIQPRIDLAGGMVNMQRGTRTQSRGEDRVVNGSQAYADNRGWLPDRATHELVSATEFILFDLGQRDRYALAGTGFVGHASVTLDLAHAQVQLLG
jgi:hypothetical protein